MRIELIEHDEVIGHFIASKVPEAGRLVYGGRQYWVDAVQYDIDTKTYSILVGEVRSLAREVF